MYRHFNGSVSNFFWKFYEFYVKFKRITKSVTLKVKLALM